MMLAESELIHHYPILALKDNYIWAVVNPKQASTVIVDPGAAQPVIDFLLHHKLRLAAILLTHHHWDHTNSVLPLLQHYSAPVYGPGKHIAGVTHVASEDKRIEIDAVGITYQVLHIPGHTLDHVAYYSEFGLFCGDTLFGAGCGRVFEGTAVQMYSSLQKIAALPNDTKLYCGHEYTLKNLHFAQTIEPNNADILHRLEQVRCMREQQQPSLPSTLKEEKITNPFLRCSAPALLARVKELAGSTFDHDPVAVFSWLRARKDVF